MNKKSLSEIVNDYEYIKGIKPASLWKRAKDKLVKNYIKISMKRLKNHYTSHFLSSFLSFVIL